MIQVHHSTLAIIFPKRIWFQSLPRQRIVQIAIVQTGYVTIAEETAEAEHAILKRIDSRISWQQLVMDIEDREIGPDTEDMVLVWVKS
jgi:hypothetical protein